MSKARWSAKDFKDNELIQVNGIYVKASSQVAKGKVEKIQIPPDFVSISKVGVLREDGNVWPIGLVDTVKNNGINQPYNPNAPFYHFESETVLLPTGEKIYVKYKFDINPQPAPRMTRSDQWKTDPFHPDPLKRQRKPVTRYFKWQMDFMALANQNGYTLQETLRVLFIMPMPKYLSRKKREMKMGQPHKQRPDTDNMLKSIKDVFKSDDGFVWDERGVKVWGEKGQIIIF